MFDKASRKDESEIVNEEDNTKYFNYSVQLMQKLLQFLGAWPLKSTFYPKYLRILLIGVSSFLLVIFTISFSLYMYFVEKDFKMRLRLAGPLSFWLMNVMKYWSVMSKNDEIRDSLLWILKDWQTSCSAKERSLMLDKARTARYFTIICVVFMYCSGMFYTISFPYTQEKIVVHNVSMRLLTYPSYFIFFDPYVMPTRDIIFVMQCFSGFIAYTVTSAVCSIAIVCTLHVCGQIAVTSWMLQNFSPSSNEQIFGEIIRKHLRSLKFARKLEHLMNTMCTVELVGCTFNICMLGYYFITEYDPTNKTAPYMYCLLLISFTFNIFIFCYIGDLLTEECDSIGKVAYSVNWYCMTRNEARNLIMIVALTQHSVILTAGKMATLSLKNFTNVLKASLSYLNVLRTVTANNPQ